jgi:uncharacterized protein YeaO (DUF488 family)
MDRWTRRNAVSASSPTARSSAIVSGMDAPIAMAMPTSREIAPTGVVMSSAEYAALTRELESAHLRRWYGHDPERFEEFARRYRAELGAQRERLSELCRRSRTGVVTLVFAARDAEHSNATVLGDVLRRGLR